MQCTREIKGFLSDDHHDHDDEDEAKKLGRWSRYKLILYTYLKICMDICVIICIHV